MRKILFLTNNPNLGSTARILQSWLELGRSVGLEGVVVAQSEGDLTRWLESRGFPCRVDPMPWPDRRWPIPSLGHAWRVARWARRQGVELVHCNEHNVYPFGLMLRRLLGVPLVCHVRFLVSRAFCEWAFGLPSRRPDALLWTSCQQRDDSAAAVAGLVPEQRQRILYLGLDLGRFGRLGAGRDATRREWGVASDEIVVGTASAFKPIKRLEEFIDLVADLASENPRIVGRIAGDAMPGDEAYREDLLGRIASKELGRRLQWLGNLEPIEPFHHALDIFVSTCEYETFGNSVCEAMACGRAVAAYRGGSVGEVVGAAGRVVETGDLAGLKAAVRELAEQSQFRLELGQAARQRVTETFDPAKTLIDLMSVYASLLNRERGLAWSDHRELKQTNAAV